VSQIFLIDADEAYASRVQLTLEFQGHHVTHAPDGSDLKIAAATADVLVTELLPDGGDGLDAIEDATQLNPELHAIVVTDRPTIRAFQRAQRIGIAAFLTKPATSHELVAAVSKCLGEEPTRCLTFSAPGADALRDIRHHFGTAMELGAEDLSTSRARIEESQRTCLIIEATAPKAATFVEMCREILDRRIVFIACNDAHFRQTQSLLTLVPSATCLDLGLAPEELLRFIAAEVQKRRSIEGQLRSSLAGGTGRCTHATPYRSGYYCNLAGTCPFGEDKELLLGVNGQVYDRCPRATFRIPDLSRVQLASFSRRSKAETQVPELRTRTMERARGGGDPPDHRLHELGDRSFQLSGAAGRSYGSDRSQPTGTHRPDQRERVGQAGAHEQGHVHDRDPGAWPGHDRVSELSADESAARTRMTPINGDPGHRSSEVSAPRAATVGWVPDASALLAMITDAIVVVDEAHRIVFFSPSASRLFGYSADEVLGGPLDRLLPTGAVAVHRDHVRTFAASSDQRRSMGMPRMIRARRKNGTEVPCAAHITKLTQDGRLLFVALLRDRTRRRLEDKDSLMQEATSALSAASDLGAASIPLLRNVCALTGWAIGEAWVVNTDAEALEFRASWSDGVSGADRLEEAARTLSPFPRGEGLWTWGKAVWIPDIESAGTLFKRPEIARAIGVKGIVVLPLANGSDVVGALLFFILRESGPDEEELVEFVAEAVRPLGSLVRALVLRERETAATARMTT
jgi:PAS domain S-box-containing protein